MLSPSYPTGTFLKTFHAHHTCVDQFRSWHVFYLLLLLAILIWRSLYVLCWCWFYLRPTSIFFLFWRFWFGDRFMWCVGVVDAKCCRLGEFSSRVFTILCVLRKGVRNWCWLDREYFETRTVPHGLRPPSPWPPPGTRWGWSISVGFPLDFRWDFTRKN